MALGSPFSLLLAINMLLLGSPVLGQNYPIPSSKVTVQETVWMFISVDGVVQSDLLVIDLFRDSLTKTV